MKRLARNLWLRLKWWWRPRTPYHELNFNALLRMGWTLEPKTTHFSTGSGYYIIDVRYNWTPPTGLPPMNMVSQAEAEAAHDLMDKCPKIIAETEPCDA